MLPDSQGSLRDGIILVDKDEGNSSFDIVKGVKRILGRKKVGHAGTLDPFATGLLVILLGQGTKLSPYLMEGKKRYLATIHLGIETDTLDVTGKVINEIAVPGLDKSIIVETLKRFKGVIEQTPPAYSALNVNGQRAYKLARKGIDVKLKKRSVSVYSIDLVSFNLPEIKIDVTSSPGTYIRSLALDIGRELGSVAHLKSLRRISSGSFSVDEAFDWSNADSFTVDDVQKKIISLNAALPDMLGVEVNSDMAARIKNGYKPFFDDLLQYTQLPDIFSGSIKLTNNSSLVAIVELKQSHEIKNNRIKKMRVFN